MLARTPALGALALVAALALGSAGAHATVAVVPPLVDLCRGSEVVVHAVVVDQETRRERDRLVTLTTLEVIEGARGAAKGELIVVFQPGGDLDGESAWIPGAYRFALHEELVLFGVRHRGRVVSYGVGVGVFDVVPSASGALAIERLGEVAVATPTPSGRVLLDAPKPRPPLPLDELLRLARGR